MNSAARSSAKAYIYHSLTAYCAACAGTAVAGGLTARRRIEDCRCALVGPDRDGAPYAGPLAGSECRRRY